MIASIRRWLIARRFKRLFVEPTEPRLNACRNGHKAGAAAVLKERQRAVHAALGLKP